MKEDASCKLVNEYGVTSQERRWLAFLSSRRETFAIPTANCLGYILNQREDARVDPNRDFGYMRPDHNCMRSSTARLFLHLMAATLAQVVITFHGGMVAIAYEWGSKNHMAPDDKRSANALTLFIILSTHLMFLQS